jgi:cytochrome c-type biogenesis protein CcmH
MTPMRRLLVSLGLLILAAAGPAVAVQPDEMLKDPALEARARALSAELRCMVCQNQSIDDSDAPLAHDLRVLLRERIAAGDSDAAVIDFLVARYGEFILLRPRVNGHTWLLWATPPAVLLIGAAAAFAVLRRRAAAAPPKALDAEEQAALDRLLKR